MRLPIRARLTLVTSALLALVLVGLAAFLYTALDANLRATVDAGLRSRAGLLLDRIHEGGGVSTGALTEGDEAFAQLQAPDGSVIETSAGVSESILTPAQVRNVDDALAFSDTTVVTDEERVPARMVATRTGPGDVLVVGASVEEQQEALAGLLSLLAIGIPAAVILASVVGWLMAGAALRPVERLRREADAISSSEPGRRLAVPPTGDELSRMAVSLNAMLGRLEAAVEQERRFLADASHELRTPLANLRAELDLALRRARTADELATALRSVREETDRLGRLADDLLVLARFHGGAPALRREATGLDGMVTDTVESFAGRAESLARDLRAEIGAAGNAMIDAVRIRQAIGNLVDNALRHARTRVTVATELLDDHIEIRVADDGPGFPPGFVERIGPGFIRPDASRERGTGGTGLGLAIVRGIVEAHGGTVRFENGPAGGALVTISLPS